MSRAIIIAGLSIACLFVDSFARATGSAVAMSDACQYALSPTTQTFGANGGSDSFSVLATNNCGWTATSNASWLTLTSSLSGSGSGRVNYSVAVNTDANPRTATVSIGGNTFTVNQAGASVNGACALTPINPGQTINAALTTNDCRSPLRIQDGVHPFADRYSFTGASGQPVIISLNSTAFDGYLYLLNVGGAVIVQNDDSGASTLARIPAGNGFFTLPSSGTFIIEVTSFNGNGSSGGLGSYTLSLSGPAGGCNYSISPGSQTFAPGGGTGMININTAANCARTATRNNAWLTITAGGSGTGSGAVSYSVAANSGGARTGTLTVAGNTFTINQASGVTLTATSVSAASYSAIALAPESIAAVFGSALATSTAVATTVPLPTSLAGTIVKVKDSLGTERIAPLFFVSAGQINYQIPLGTAPGAAAVTITSGDGTVSTGTMQIGAVAPGLFSANADGQGVAAAGVLRVRGDGSRSDEVVASYDQTQQKFVALPIDLGPETDQVFLILYGTGFRNRSALDSTSVKIGGVNAEVLYAGAQGGFVGLDQLNVRIPRSLVGRGEADIVLTVDGKAANTVRVKIK